MAGDMQAAAIEQFKRDGVQMHKAVAALLAHVEQSYGLFRDSALSRRNAGSGDKC